MKVEFTNNQYDKEGVYREPEIEVKTFLYECNREEFLDLYLTQIGIKSRHLKFYKCLLKFMDKAGGFSLPLIKEELEDNGFSVPVSQVYISELSHVKVAGVPVVKKVNNGVWKIPKDILFFGDNQEYKIYVIRK
jgi:hypothetical protein